MSDDFRVMTCGEEMLTFVDSLQKKNAEALAFYPKQVFEREILAGRVFVGLLNGWPCGYIYAGSPIGTMRCHQVCIEYDARRRLYGASLVQHVEDYAKAHGADAVSLRCGFDLDANQFWGSLGYEVVAHQKGGARRMRVINVWRKTLRADLLEGLIPALAPAEGKTSATAWAKSGKRQGSRFARGAALQTYRDAIEAGP